MRMLRFLAILAAALALSGPSIAQNSPSGAAKKSTKVDTEKLYIQALGDVRKPDPVDQKVLAEARAWVDSLDGLRLVDQEILGAARNTSEILFEKNKDKHTKIRMFAEHEIVPYLFKNSDAFRDLFAIAIADTLTLDEIKQVAAAGRVGPQDAFAGKATEAVRKYDRAAAQLANIFTAQMIEKANFAIYGLDLSPVAAAKP
jgi:hypothetical protein